MDDLERTKHFRIWGFGNRHCKNSLIEKDDNHTRLQSVLKNMNLAKSAVTSLFETF